MDLQVGDPSCMKALDIDCARTKETNVEGFRQDQADQTIQFWCCGNFRLLQGMNLLLLDALHWRSNSRMPKQGFSREKKAAF